MNGALRVMKHLGLREEAPDPRYDTIQLKKSQWIRGSFAGLYHSFVRPGETVNKGQQVGLITGPFGDFERQIKSPIDGEIIAVNNIPVINRGDALMHVGIIDN